MAQLLSIPPPFLEGLQNISSLSDGEFDQLVENLKKVPPRMRQQSSFSVEDIELPSSVSPDIAVPIVETVIGLCSSQLRVKVQHSVFAEDIVRSLEAGFVPEDVEWIRGKGVAPKLRERLSRILNVSAVRLVIKARDVLVEHAKTYSSARIVTDIRPVFGENVDESPIGAVIVHMLNLDYYSEGTRREFVAAMDTKDIQDLIDTLERAKRKTETLKPIINSSGTTYIEVI